jgi:uncharacterized protein YjbJ (UPF0337 family)
LRCPRGAPGLRLKLTVPPQAICPRPNYRRGIMGLGDKIDNTAEKLGGKGKEAAGKATDDRSLEAEGKGDQVKADLKQAGEKVKDAFKKD